jgi:tetratricopeptide (TPR) repeat protein
LLGFIINKILKSSLLKAYLCVGFFIILTLLGGCANLPQTAAILERIPSDIPSRVELENVPFFPQDDYQCGPAALATVLNASGIKIEPETLVGQVYIPSKKGSLQIEMLASIRRQGRIAYELQPQLIDILREIHAGRPVLVLENFNTGFSDTWHYAVVVGYDLNRKELISRSGINRRETLSFNNFEYIWKQGGYWALVVLSLDELPATVNENYYAQSVLALEQSGHLKQAKTAYQTLLKRWPKNLIGQIGLGNTAYALGDLASAKLVLTQAIQNHPESAMAHNNLAHVLADLGDMKEAIKTAEKAISLGGPFLELTKETLNEIQLKEKNLKLRHKKE